MKSIELKQKRDGLFGELDKLANKAELTAEEKTRWDTLMVELRNLEKEIRIEEDKENYLRLRASQEGQSLSPKEERDIRNYSFVKAIQEAISGKLTGLEAEMHQEAVAEMARMGQPIVGIGVPSKVLRVSRGDYQKRADVTTSTATFVQTNVTGFIDALYAKLFAVEAGASVMSGLTGNVSIPRVGTAATAGWATEVANASDAGSDTDSVSLTPKRLACYQDVSKQLILQSAYNVEGIMRRLFISAMYVALERAIINGATNGPTGLLNTSGIGSVAGGTNGAAPTLANMLALIKTIGAANAEFDNLAFAMSPQARWKLQSTAIESGQPERVWKIDVPDNLLGYKAFVSTCVPDNLDKGTSVGVCSAIIFANWQELIIAQFGGIDITVDALSQAIGNKVRIVLNSFWDSGLKHPASFAAMKDALCAS
ncbi:MAG: phage major capsid protein [Bacteroidales bacterium]|nr:phage major capsid protein [Bacteroidales bacterium]